MKNTQKVWGIAMTFKDSESKVRTRAETLIADSYEEACGNALVFMEDEFEQGNALISFNAKAQDDYDLGEMMKRQGWKEPKA